MHRDLAGIWAEIDRDPRHSGQLAVSVDMDHSCVGYI
jgi:hypothetical protein